MAQRSGWFLLTCDDAHVDEKLEDDDKTVEDDEGDDAVLDDIALHDVCQSLAPSAQIIG